MKIEFKLQDESICRGCPLDWGTIVCRAGFTRGNAKILKESPKEHEYFRFPKWSTGDDNLVGVVELMRPKECLEATEVLKNG